MEPASGPELVEPDKWVLEADPKYKHPVIAELVMEVQEVKEVHDVNDATEVVYGAMGLLGQWLKTPEVLEAVLIALGAPRSWITALVHPDHGERFVKTSIQTVVRQADSRTTGSLAQKLAAELHEAFLKRSPPPPDPTKTQGEARNPSG